MQLLKFFQDHIFVPVRGPALYAWCFAAVVVSLFGLAMLSNLPPAARKRLIAALTFLAGGFYVLEFMLPANGPAGFANPFTPWIGPVGVGVQILGTFAGFLGMLNLTMVHGRNVARQSAGWGNSLVLLIALHGTCVIGIWKAHWPDWPASGQKIEFAHAGKSLTLAETAWEFVFNGMLNPLDATMFSLLAFFITSAAFRAFRLRSVEATLLMTTAFLVMFGLTPFGRVVTEHIFPTDGMLASFQADSVQNWIMKIINTPMNRGILIGYQVGALAMAMRIWLNLEKGSYFDSAG